MIPFELGTLSPIQVRVLGTLIEKSLTTPEYYPLSLNSLTTGCNQKSSRYPVTDYFEADVLEACNQLKAVSMISLAISGSSRTSKFKHNFTSLLNLSEAEITILGLLFLRGPLTPGEINSMSGRMHQFADLESILNTIHQLISKEEPLVKLLEKKPGQKEARYTHLFGTFLDEDQPEKSNETSDPTNTSLMERIDKLEKEIEQLKSIVDQLKALL